MPKYFKSLQIRFMFWQDFDDAIAAENNVPANDNQNLSESGSTVPDWLRRVITYSMQVGHFGSISSE